jgi:hypothetical protein
MILRANSILKGHLNSASTVAMDAGACYGTEEGILTLTEGAGSCSGLIEPDTLIRDNIYQLLRCRNGTKTNEQTVF